MRADCSVPRESGLMLEAIDVLHHLGELLQQLVILWRAHLLVADEPKHLVHQFIALQLQLPQRLGFIVMIGHRPSATPEESMMYMNRSKHDDERLSSGRTPLSS